MQLQNGLAETFDKTLYNLLKKIKDKSKKKLASMNWTDSLGV